MKRITAPIDVFKGEDIIPMDYLIEVDGDNFLVHRELGTEEKKQYKREQIFEYEGKEYIHAINNFPSKELAEKAIETYWDGIKKLNNLIKNL